MKKIYLLITIIVFFIILASCYTPLNPSYLIVAKPYKTASGVYQVYTKDNLLWVLQNATNSFGHIANDILLKKNVDMGGAEFEAIAGIDGAAVFDGGGYAVKNFNMNIQGNSGTKEASFIISNLGTVKNLTIENAVVNLDNSSGINSHASGVVAYNTGLVEMCRNIGGSVSSKGMQNYIGGIVGINSSGGVVSNCYNTSKLYGESPNSGLNYVGGIVGQNEGTIQYCYNKGSISGKITGVIGVSALGGISGGSPTFGGITPLIEHCYNTGEIRDTGSDIGPSVHIGGITGIGFGTIQYCYDIGSIIAGSGVSIGGVVGWNPGSVITACYFLTTTAANGIGFPAGSPAGSTTSFTYPFAIPLGWNTPIAVWEMATISGNQRPVLIGVGIRNER